MPSVKYVCARDGCWNRTTEVLCRKHRMEQAQRRVDAVVKGLVDHPKEAENE